ncbi:DinB family protein [Camelliibacillus cellulosilyticus]|uniref:DinB family protein n=1 Tax=Camelliibacillus cellulosilyticus TaxID=2174486 RepID=A0ABV9GN38_9BACL
MDQRPIAGEYSPYFDRYVKLVPDGDITQVLKEQSKATAELLDGLTDEQASFRYEKGKWSIKEVIGHVIDTERVFSYRLLAIARGEMASLPGFDQDAYVEAASFDQTSFNALLDHFSAVRQATVCLLRSLNARDWIKKGNANGADITVRALAYIMAGHELHHRRIIKDRYLAAPDFEKL